MRRDYKFYVYIATNKNNKVLYTGVTNCIERRYMEHLFKKNPDSFTARYNVSKIVYYEIYKYFDKAVEREKQIKAGSRKKKIELIHSINPKWEDLIEMYHFNDG